jgi:hypothetical protein
MLPNFSAQNVKTILRQFLRQVIFELRLHLKRLKTPRRRPCVVVFPSNQPWDAASNLRAWLIGPELERLGWRVILVPEALSLSQRHRILRLEKPDVVLLQQTRHPLNQPHLYPSFPCVLDADDADYLDSRHHERIGHCAEAAAAVIGGSRFVAKCLGRHNEVSHMLWTCTPKPLHPPVASPHDRSLIVAWAHASPLAYPQEAEFVQRIMVDVCQRTRCTFWLFGTTEPQAQSYFFPLREAGGTCVAIPPMNYEEYLVKVAEAAVGLQPVSELNEFSQGKSFGKLLAYLAGQVAVVASDAVDHPLFFRTWENGVVLPNDAQAWSDSIVTLLENPVLRSRLALAGWGDFHDHLTSDVFARLLAPILDAASKRSLPVSPISA